MQKYAKLPVSFQCNERDSVTNFIYHSESYNAIYVNLVSIENSQIRVCSAGVSDTVSIGFLFIAYTGGKYKKNFQFQHFSHLPPVSINRWCTVSNSKWGCFENQGLRGR
jgi:hypothetical protein